MVKKIDTTRDIHPHILKNGKVSKAKREGERAIPNNPKSLHKKPPPRSRWTKKNPHPDHIKQPTKYTIYGKPRCSHINRKGEQCGQKTIDGTDSCVFHTEIVEENATRKRSRVWYENKDRLIALVAEGWTLNAAAGKCGVYPTTATTWMRRGREAIARGEYDNEYAVWYLEIEKSKVVACSNVEHSLYKAALDGNVSACIKYLACRMPEVWSEKRVVEMQGEVNVSGNISNTYRSMSTEEIRKSMKNMAKEIDLALNERDESLTDEHSH